MIILFNLMINVSVVPAKCIIPLSIVTIQVASFMMCQQSSILVLFIKLRPFLISKLNTGFCTLKNAVSLETTAGCTKVTYEEQKEWLLKNTSYFTEEVAGDLNSTEGMEDL
jgi:hypothetical protein